MGCLYLMAESAPPDKFTQAVPEWFVHKVYGDSCFSRHETNAALEQYSMMLRSLFEEGPSTDDLPMRVGIDLGKTMTKLGIKKSSISANYDTFYERGTSAWKASEKETAIKNFNYAIRLNSLFPLSYLLRASVYYDSKLFDAALADIDKLIMLYPDFYLPHHIKGKILYEQGYPDAAVISLTRTLELKPDNTESFLLREKIYKELDKNCSSLLGYNQAIEPSAKSDNSRTP